MLDKLQLKQTLLATGYFIANTYLDQYLDLVLNPSDEIGYKENHHILQVSYYKHKYNCKTYAEAVKFANTDEANMCVSLLYKDHCKAHWLLYYCTKDFLKTDNMSAVEYIKKMYTKLANKKRFDFNDIDFDIIQNYMNNIINDAGSKWYADYQIEFLINNYKSLGAARCAELLNRTVGSVHSKAIELRLCSERPKLWTVEEDAILTKYFPLEGGKVCTRLPGRSELACRKRAFKLGLASEYFNWPKEAIDYLQANYQNLGPEVISNDLYNLFNIKKSKDACRSMALKFNLHFTKKSNAYANLNQKSTYRIKWTPELDLILQQYYPHEGGLCAERIPGASRQAVVCRALKLKIKFIGD